MRKKKEAHVVDLGVPPRISFTSDGGMIPTVNKHMYAQCECQDEKHFEVIVDYRFQNIAKDINDLRAQIVNQQYDIINLKECLEKQNTSFWRRLWKR